MRLIRGPDQRIDVPTARAVFAKEIAIPPRRRVEGGTLTRWIEIPRGGHFAALEEPALSVGDVRAFFRTPRQAGGKR